MTNAIMKCIRIALACSAALAVSTPASASGYLPAGMFALFQSAGPSACVAMTYDKNGNIQARGNTTFGSSAVWGSSVFGCFRWTL